jgi:putative endonuclease
MFYVYALYSSKFNKIYVGQTIDLEKRLNEHNSGLSNYTKRFMPWKIIYTEKFETRTEAIKREKQLKSQKGREFVWKHIGKEYTAGL